MVFAELKQERHNAFIGLLMLIIAVLFLLYMGSSLVSSTRAFWENPTAAEIVLLVLLGVEICRNDAGFSV